MSFAEYHPFLNLLFFSAVLPMSLLFDNPIYIFSAFICSLIYSIKLGGKKSAVFHFICFAVSIIFPFYYASYQHFGVTELSVNFIGNSITLESLVYGFSLIFRFNSFIQWCSCMNKILTSDKIIYLIGRVSPVLSLYISILLRTVPQLKKQLADVRFGQSVLGKGLGQTGIFNNLIIFFKLCSVAVSYIIEDFFHKSNSMTNRGYRLKGKTKFSIYRFDNRDRTLVFFLFSCLIFVAMALSLEQTYIQYQPQIFMRPISIGSIIFVISYIMFCFAPLFLELKNQWKFYINLRRTF